MKSLMQTIPRITTKWLGSPKFFYVLVGLLVFQALWIALTARYPQAFDENFHFGLIQLHAQQWLPWFDHQPAGADIYGAVARDPSYFYHYLLSFPYRLLELVTTSQAAQVIALRLLNVGLFAGGLFAYRVLFDELGISGRLRHVVLLFFVLTPIVPLLAGQINYDNLLFLLSGWLFVYTVRFWRAAQDSGELPADLMLKVLFFGALGSIVKYAFAPIFMGLFVVLAAGTWLVWRKRRDTFKQAFKVLKRSTVIVYAVLIVAAGVLFVERYGVNLLRYQTPVPDCAVALNVEQCLSYSPWARDYKYQDIYPKPTAWGIFVYPGVWAHRMVFETMFSITSRFSDDGPVDYFPVPPLTIANYTAWTVVVLGVGACLLYIKRLWRLEYLRILLLVIGFYTVVLFLKNLSMYLHTGEAVAIHGRYLVPVYPVLYLTLALGIGWALERFAKPPVKTWLVIIALLFFIHGAGLVTWLSHSRPDWYWQQSQPARQFNDTAKKVIGPVIVEQIP